LYICVTLAQTKQIIQHEANLEAMNYDQYKTATPLETIHPEDETRNCVSCDQEFDDYMLTWVSGDIEICEECLNEYRSNPEKVISDFDPDLEITGTEQTGIDSQDWFKWYLEGVNIIPFIKTPELIEERLKWLNSIYYVVEYLNSKILLECDRVLLDKLLTAKQTWVARFNRAAISTKIAA